MCRVSIRARNPNVTALPQAIGGLQRVITIRPLANPPTSIQGLRRPQRERVLSDKYPITGSSTISTKRGTAVAVDTSSGWRPSAVVRICCTSALVPLYIKASAKPPKLQKNFVRTGTQEAVASGLARCSSVDDPILTVGILMTLIVDCLTPYQRIRHRDAIV